MMVFVPEPEVRKIAVLRANGLGDFVFSLPALDALRATYPKAEIVLLGKAMHAALLTGRPGPIARVVVVPPARGVGEDNEYPETAETRTVQEEFFRAMAAERFDLAFQIHGGGRYSNPFLRRLGARITIGLKTPDAAPLDRWVPYVYFQPEVLRYLEVVALAGATTTALDTLEPRLTVTAADRAEAAALIPAVQHGPTGAPKPRPIVALHPGATDGRRHWPVEKFAEVGDALARAGAQVVVTGDDSERALVEDVVGAMSAEAQDLGGRLSLGGLAGLLSRCAVVVSNDSGPLHLAAAVGAATVGIYWCGNLINGGPLTRTRHRPSVSWRLNCPVCGVNCIEGRCEHRGSFVADIPAEEIIASALDLLALGRPETSGWCAP